MTDLFSVADKTALVTGASRGLGKAIAIALAAKGARVLCSCSHKGGAKATVDSIIAAGGEAQELVADLADEQSVRQLAMQALQLGSVDILVNCGGTIFRAPAHEFPMAEWHKVIAVNLDAAFLLAQLVGVEMIKRRSGKIINIASMLSYSGGITVPAYTASKHAIAGVTKALANEWAQHNIQVNAIAPG
ncbi:SDR family NAD(P)-dependent oxidoreductase, partial [Alishewanella sp. SMS9]|nr:SDR family NAD(P)-dependent oxidoreductase [Alishewanella sp. SMS9]